MILFLRNMSAKHRFDENCGLAVGILRLAGRISALVAWRWGNALFCEPPRAAVGRVGAPQHGASHVEFLYLNNSE
jgi:hypothetical protein